MKISINSDTAVSNLSMNKTEITDAYKLLASSGFSGIDQSIPHLYDSSPLTKPEFDIWMNVISESAFNTGIAFAQCHCPLLSPVEFSGGHASFIHDDLRKKAYDDVFRAANLWNCPVVVHPITFPFFSDESLWEEYARLNIEYFKTLLEYAEKYNVKIAAENLFDIKDSARHYCSEPEHLEFIVNSLNSEKLGVCIDTGHAFMSGFQPDIFINRFKDKVYALHIHDNNGFSDQHNLLPFGNIDWKKFISSIKEINYQGFFNYEVHGHTVYEMNSNSKSAYYKYAIEIANEMLNNYKGE